MGWAESPSIGLYIQGPETILFYMANINSIFI